MSGRERRERERERASEITRVIRVLFDHVPVFPPGSDQTESQRRRERERKGERERERKGERERGGEREKWRKRDRLTAYAFYRTR